jgi:hypothetical protein
MRPTNPMILAGNVMYGTVVDEPGQELDRLFLPTA